MKSDSNAINKGNTVVLDGTIYLSNSYDLFCYLNNFLGLKTTDDLNLLSEIVIKNGDKIEVIYLDHKLEKHVYNYGNHIFEFIVNYSSDSKYALLSNFYNGTNLYPGSKNKKLSTNLSNYTLENTYESFLNFTKYNNITQNSRANIPFYGDFESSLFSSDLLFYNKDEFFNFFTIENINRPSQYFYFLAFDNRICVTQYTKSRKLDLDTELN